MKEIINKKTVKRVEYFLKKRNPNYKIISFVLNLILPKY